jgi:hypothetical protein
VLKRAFEDIPFTLIDRKRRFPVIPRILVCLGNYPRRSIRDSLYVEAIRNETANEVYIDAGLQTYQVENLALKDKDVERVHDFLNKSIVIPPMYVKDVDIGRA